MRTRDIETRAELEAETSRRIRIALSWEVKRDRLPWESADYWRAHDKSIYWHLRAEALMPGGSELRETAPARRLAKS